MSRSALNRCGRFLCEKSGFWAARGGDPTCVDCRGVGGAEGRWCMVFPRSVRRPPPQRYISDCGMSVSLSGPLSPLTGPLPLATNALAGRTTQESFKMLGTKDRTTNNNLPYLRIFDGKSTSRWVPRGGRALGRFFYRFFRNWQIGPHLGSARAPVWVVLGSGATVFATARARTLGGLRVPRMYDV